MKQKNYWLRTLNVRPDEWWLVKKLFVLQFLQGAGIAFFFTAAYALFLNKIGITELPYVFIYSSFLLWATGYLYAKIEHKFSTGKMAVISTIFIAISILLFRVAFVFEKSDWFLYWMLAWFNVLYLINNLEFWGLAALLFDVRQSKRLFGVISAGDIPAKFIGYTLALLTVEYIGTINLFWAAAACVLASLPFLKSVLQSEKLAEIHHAKKHHHKQTTRKVTVLAKYFSGNTLVRRLATLTIIISTCFIIINYAFYAGVKEAYKDDVSMAKFIAFFLAITRIVAMLIKVIFTSRLITRLGIIKSLMITPVAMILLICLVLVTEKFSPGSRIIFYLFGVTAIAIDVLRSSINSPVFLTIMQPLPTHERLRAHTIIKGIMDPFASLITGIILLVVIKYQHGTDLKNLYYILLVMGFLWVIGIYRTNSEYLKTIIKTISSHYFNRDDFRIDDAVPLKWLKEKILTGNETEVINILKILDSRKNELSDELVLAALKRPSERIKAEALNLIHGKNINIPEKELIELLQKESSSKITAQLINILCKNGVAGSLISPYLENSNPEIRNAAILGILKYNSGELKNKVEKLVQQMSVSTDQKDQLTAAETMGELKSEEAHNIILALMRSPDKAVRNAAFASAGKSRNNYLLKEVAGMIDTDEKEVFHALGLAGEHAIPHIHSLIINKKTSSQHKQKLIQLAGRINGIHSHQMLITLLQQQPELYKPVIKALYRSQYSPPSAKKRIEFEDAAVLLLENSAAILYMLNRLENQQEKYQVLINSLAIELNDLRDSLLYVFSILYGRDKINQVRSAYSAQKKDNIINAMEIIEMVVRKDLANKFNTIFEPGSITNRINELHQFYPDQFFRDIEQILIRILSDEKYAYHYWTMACSLYTSKKQQHRIDAILIEKYTSAENTLLRETAEYAR